MPNESAMQLVVFSLGEAESACAVSGMPRAVPEAGGSSGRTIRVHLADMRVTSRVAGSTETELYGQITVAA